MLTKENVQKVLEEIRPSLQADGGDVELINVLPDEGIVEVKLTGACHGCPMAEVTLHQGIGVYLQKKLPEVKEVRAVK